MSTQPTQPKQPKQPTLPTHSSPIILGIESATSRVGCAIGTPLGILAARESSKPRQHAESLVPQIAEILDEAALSFTDIDALAVDVGPGLYTGLRVGITTAITMAHALDKPLVALTSLELVAHAIRSPEHSYEQIDVVIDARRGEVFHAAFTSAHKPISEATVVKPEVLAKKLSQEAPNTCLAGDGVEAYQAIFAQAGLSTNNATIYPSAETIVELAVAAVLANKTTEPAKVRPLYLRGPDAQPIAVPTSN